MVTNGPYRTQGKPEPPERLREKDSYNAKSQDKDHCYLCQETVCGDVLTSITTTDETHQADIYACPSCRDKIEKCGNCFYRNEVKGYCRIPHQINIRNTCTDWKQRNFLSLETLREMTQTSPTSTTDFL